MFHVGQKVACADDKSPGHIAGLPVNLRKGCVYTVTRIGLTHPFDPDQLPCIQIAEEGRLHFYWAHRFRPIVERKADISIFTKMLKPAEEKV